MPGDYIPAKDLDLRDWCDNFAAVITSSPTVYGLDAGQASAFVTLQIDFSDALTAATTPATRTSVTVAAKDTARSQVVSNARSLAKIAQGYPGVTDELLSTAGLTVRDPIPSPIPAPTTKPVLSLITANSLQLVVRYKDSVLTNPRAKPPGVIGLQMFTKTGGTAPADIAECVFAGQYTRVPATLDFAGAAAGETVYMLARWYTAKGLTGPTSDLFSATVPA